VADVVQIQKKDTVPVWRIYNLCINRQQVGTADVGK